MQPVTSSALPDTSLFNLDGIGEGRELSTDSTELLDLDSLFPVFELLPGLTQEKNSGYYYVQGEIEPSDQESLYNYTKCIGELTLGEEPDFDSRLLHVLARIGQLQDPNQPLFPHLHAIFIVGPSLSLIFLHLLLSSALTTLQLAEIPVVDPCYASVLSFLECAVYRAPNLSTLIFGPGLIPRQILDISLIKLVLQDNGTSTCDQPLPISVCDTQTFYFDDGRVVTSPPFLERKRVDRSEAVLFSTLQTLEVDGTSDLIQILVDNAGSSDLQALSINVTKPKEAEEIGWWLIQWEMSVTNMMILLTRSIRNWQNSLVSVILKNDSSPILSLPSAVFEDLLLRPDMEHLEIFGMNIASMDHTLHRLREVGNSQLECLLLPIHCSTTGISLAELRVIAEACPRLQSFRCPFKNLSDVEASDPLSHPLKVLSVNDGEGQIGGNFKAIREIAHYLDSIFPNLMSFRRTGLWTWKSCNTGVLYSPWCNYYVKLSGWRSINVSRLIACRGAQRIESTLVFLQFQMIEVER